MKKTIIAFICMVAGLLSCTNDDNFVEEQTSAGVPMTFNISVDEGAATRAAKTAWANGDKIYVFFNGLETKYLVLTYDGTSWSYTSGGGTLESTDFSGLETKTITAVHFPVAVDVTYADSKFSFTSDSKPVYNYYLYETGKAYTVSGTTVNATLSMGKPADMVQIHVAGIQDNISAYTFGCSKIKPVACASVGTDGAITESVLQAGARVSGFADSDGGIFSGRLVYPDEAKDYTFTVASDANIYTLTRTGKTLTAGRMYNFPSLSTTGGSNWTVQNASDLYVDLGLGVKWAKYNLGATTETDYGDYFAWGEVTGYNEGKTDFDWSTYTYASGNASNTLTKYCYNSDFGITDALTTLLPEDDAAYAALGGKFRMPTKDEMEALTATKSNTTDYTWTWCDGSTTKYNDTDVPGWKIVKNSSSATLFLPATAGGWNGTEHKLVGTASYYWTSSLYMSTYPYCAYGSESRAGGYGVSALAYRCSGYSVRPVYAE